MLRVLSHRHGPERNELARLGFGASERTAGDDAGADDLTRMSDFDLTRHVRSRGETRDRGRREVSAERRQLLGGRRGGLEDRDYDHRCRQDDRLHIERATFLYETVIGHRLASVSLAARSEARNFFEVILPHGPKTACIAQTWV